MKKILSLILVGMMIATGLVGLLSLTSESAQAAGLADSPWPTFNGNLKRTGLSPYDTSHVDGTVKWSVSVTGDIKSSPVIDSDGNVYVTSEDSSDNCYLTAVSNTGTIKWTYNLGTALANNGFGEGSLTISSDGTIYVGSPDGNVYAITLQGTKLWNYSSGYSFLSAPAIGADGTIYAAGKGLYALGPNGNLKWSFGTDQFKRSSPAIGDDGTVYVGSNDDKLYAINPDGTLKWSYDTGNALFSPAIGSDGTIYIASWSTQSYLYAISKDGAFKWKFEYADKYSSYSPSIGGDGSIYIGAYIESADPHARLVALDSSGNTQWDSGACSSTSGSRAIGSDGTIYFGGSNGNIYALDSTGKLKWSFDTGDYANNPPAIGSDGTVYVGSGYKLYALGGSSTNAVDIHITSVSPRSATPDNDFIDIVDSSSDNPDSVEHYLIYPDGYTSSVGSGGVGGWGFDLSNQASVDGKTLVEGTYTVKDVAKKSGYADGVDTATFYYTSGNTEAALFSEDFETGDDGWVYDDGSISSATTESSIVYEGAYAFKMTGAYDGDGGYAGAYHYNVDLTITPDTTFSFAYYFPDKSVSYIGYYVLFNSSDGLKSGIYFSYFSGWFVNTTDSYLLQYEGESIETWHHHDVNLYNDYMDAFSSVPSDLKIEKVRIMMGDPYHSGNVQTAYFDDILITTGGGKTASVPSAPYDVFVDAGDSYVSLSWNASGTDGDSPITQFKIYRGTYPGGETLLTTVDNVEYVEKRYTDTTVINGQTYYYQVSAVNSVGEGPKSDEISATPAGGWSGERNLTITVNASTGGDVALDGATLSIPPDALAENATVTISTVTASEVKTGNLKLASKVYEFNSTASFSSPVTVTISYSESDIPEGVSEEDLAIYTYQNGEWVKVGGTVDTEANTITVELSHFSMYAAMANPEQQSSFSQYLWIFIAIVISIVALLGAVIGLKKRKKPPAVKNSSKEKSPVIYEQEYGDVSRYPRNRVSESPYRPPQQATEDVEDEDLPVF